MEYLHSLGVIHRDLKPGNLLVDERNRVYVSDFGISRIANKRMTPSVGVRRNEATSAHAHPHDINRALSLSRTLSLSQTAQYMAPDVVKNEEYTQKIDVYSFAIVLWEMIERRDPYPDMQQIEIILAVKDGKRPSFSPNNIKNPAIQLIRQCWHDKAKQRPSFTQICASLKATLDRYGVEASLVWSFSVKRTHRPLSLSLSRVLLLVFNLAKR